MTEGSMQPPSQGSVPIPDPTARTMESMLREIAALRELSEAKDATIKTAIASIKDQLVVAATTSRDASTHRQELVVLQLADAEKLVNEKFLGIDRRFSERDDRLKESQASAAQGIVVGLQAQKEAAAKTELALAESLKSLSTLVNTTIAGLTDKVNTLQSRVDKNESFSGGVVSHRTEEKQNIGLIVSVVSVVSVLFSSVVAALVSFALRAHT